MAASPTLAKLTEAIQGRFGDAVRSILYYGAGLRDGELDEDGLFDLVVVVDGYRRDYGGLKFAMLNALLPPNVFYLEIPRSDRADDPQKTRCKYAVVSEPQLERWVAPGCRQVWFWGRLAQPVGVVYAADADARTTICESLAQSVRTFARKTAPLVPAPFTGEDLWTIGLKASYRTELRAERDDRSKTIVDSDRERYESLTRAAAADLGWTTDADGRHDPHVGGLARWWSRRGWQYRRWQGKTLHVLRLIKGTLTFKGGVDYILWKIERHSGVKVEVSDRARRHPILAGWVTIWKLRRKGGFR